MKKIILIIGIIVFLILTYFVSIKIYKNYRSEHTRNFVEEILENPNNLDAIFSKSLDVDLLEYSNSMFIDAKPSIYFGNRFQEFGSANLIYSGNVMDEENQLVDMIEVFSEDGTKKVLFVFKEVEFRKYTLQYISFNNLDFDFEDK